MGGEQGMDTGITLSLQVWIGSKKRHMVPCKEHDSLRRITSVNGARKS